MVSHIAEWPLAEMKTNVIRLMNEIAQTCVRQAIDPTMAIVYELAKTLGTVHVFPQPLQQLSARAILVNHLDTTVVANTPLWIIDQAGQFLFVNDLSTFLDSTASESGDYISDISDINVRVNIALRLWVGCIEAAKMIRFTSVIGAKDYSTVNVTYEKYLSPDDRFMESIRVDSIASQDWIYLAGAEAAPEFKKLRKEHYTFAGVSQNSPVRKHPNSYLIQPNTRSVSKEKEFHVYRRAFLLKYRIK